MRLLEVVRMEVFRVHFEKEWKNKEAENRGDLRLEAYEVVREFLDSTLQEYYEEEGGKSDVVGGNEYTSWSVYVVGNDSVEAYDVDVAIYWDGTVRVEVSGPRVVYDTEELKSVLYYAEMVGNKADVEIIEKLLTS